MKISKRTRTLILHDVGVFASVLIPQLFAISGHVGRDVLLATIAAAVKVTLRQLLPVPPPPPAP